MGSLDPLSSILIDLQHTLARLSLSLQPIAPTVSLPAQLHPVDPPLSLHLPSANAAYPSTLTKLAPPPICIPPSQIPPPVYPVRAPPGQVPPLKPVPTPQQNPTLPLPGFVVPTSGRSFTDIIRDSILSQPARPRPQPPRFNSSYTSGISNFRGTKSGSGTKSGKAIAMLQRLRTLSNQGVSICYRCRETGYITPDCRSSLACFSCGKVGHRSTTCRQHSPPFIHPPPPPPLLNHIPPPSHPPTSQLLLDHPSSDYTPPSVPSSPPPIPPLPDQITTPLIMLPPPPTRFLEAQTLPVLRYYATPATTQFRQSLAQWLVLTDTRRLGAHYIQAHLTKRFHFPC